MRAPLLGTPQAGPKVAGPASGILQQARPTAPQQALQGPACPHAQPPEQSASAGLRRGTEPCAARAGRAADGPVQHQPRGGELPVPARAGRPALPVRPDPRQRGAGGPAAGGRPRPGHRAHGVGARGPCGLPHARAAGGPGAPRPCVPCAASCSGCGCDAGCCALRLTHRQHGRRIKRSSGKQHRCSPRAASTPAKHERLQVALDGRVVHGVSLVSSEHITGEATPSRREPGDTLPAGARNHDGVLVVQAAEAFADSTPARIARLTQSAQVAALECMLAKITASAARVPPGVGSSKHRSLDSCCQQATSGWPSRSWNTLGRSAADWGCSCAGPAAAAGPVAGRLWGALLQGRAGGHTAGPGRPAPAGRALPEHPHAGALSVHGHAACAGTARPGARSAPGACQLLSTAQHAQQTASVLVHVQLPEGRRRA